MVKTASIIICCWVLMGSWVDAEDSIDIDRIITSEHLFFHEYGYRFSLNENMGWYQEANGVRGSAGSISTNRFYWDLDARILAFPVESLFMGYRFHKRESFSEEYLVNRADLGINFHGWCVGITGMTESRKENTDIGVITGYKRDSDCWVTTRFVWRDLIFNDKTSEDIEYIRQPFNIDMEGFWTTGSWTILGHVDVGRKWLQRGPAELVRGRKITGYGALRYGMSRGRSINFEYFHRQMDQSTEPLEGETRLTRIAMHQIYLTWTTPLTDDWTAEMGVTFVDARGNAFDELEEETPYSTINPFDFDRMDMAVLVEIGWFPMDHHWFRGRIHAGLIDSDAGESRMINGLNQTWDGKLTLEYKWRISDTGWIAAGLTGKLREMEFGGGNVRLSFFP